MHTDVPRLTTSTFGNQRELVFSQSFVMITQTRKIQSNTLNRDAAEGKASIKSNSNLP